MKCFVVVLFSLQEKQRSIVYLRPVTKKNYLLLLIKLGVLKALQGFLLFVSAYIQEILNDISTCLKIYVEIANDG